MAIGWRAGSRGGFADGSLQDEFVTYLQRPVLKLLSYKQIQRDPSFPADVEVAFTRDPNRYEAPLADQIAA